MNYVLAHPLIFLSLAVPTLFAAVYLPVFLSLRGTNYFFDPREERGGFEPHAKRYQDLARLIITLSTASAGFLFNFLVNLPADIHLRNSHSTSVEAVAPLAIGFFSVSVFFLIGFLLCENFWYEQYCHSEKQDTYFGWKYATVVASGYNGLCWFVAAFGVLAFALFRH